MKNLFLIGLFLSVFVMLPVGTNAQMMGNNFAASNNIAQDEAAGKTIWQKLQDKQISCANLSDDDFEVLGDYFMGQMAGASHEAMNTMMQQMMGNEGERQTHITMGKRLSGCDTSAAYPSRGIGFVPMMQMMMGGWSSPSGFNQTNNPMMWNFGNNPMAFGFGWFGWIFMIIFWVLIIAGIAALIKWLAGQSRGGFHDHEKSPLEILKERYAKGEIDKKEFEEKKREITG